MVYVHRYVDVLEWKTNTIFSILNFSHAKPCYFIHHLYYILYIYKVEYYIKYVYGYGKYTLGDITFDDYT